MSSPAKPAATIDDFPAEMISELFKYLRLKDLVTCSMVNKRWHSIYSSFRVNSLVAIGDIDYEIIKWYPNLEIEGKERCYLKSERFNQLAKQPLLSNLKRLALCDYLPSFDLNELNRFKQLVHLQINVHRLNEEVHLIFPKLRVLVLTYQYDHSILSVDCPELSLLAYRREYFTPDLFDVKHPETVRILDTDAFGPNLSRFKNVDCLITQQFKAVCKDTLLSLPRLNELRYNAGVSDHLWDFMEIGTIDRMKRTLREFLEDARTIRGPDFRFKFAGFKLNELELVDIDFGVQIIEGSEDADEEDEEGGEMVSNECVYMRNYRLLDADDTLDFVRYVNYSMLVENAVGEFPVCFSEKFTGIEHVRVSKHVEDESHLLGFLRSLRLLRSLDIDSSVCRRLSQEFYDHLPASTHYLTQLIFYGQDWEELQLNFDFIANFPHLLHLRIHGVVSFESISPLVKHLAKLRSGSFTVVLKKRFSIWKFKSSNEFQIRDFNYAGFETILSTEHPDEIVNFFKELQNESQAGPTSLV